MITVLNIFTCLSYDNHFAILYDGTVVHRHWSVILEQRLVKIQKLSFNFKIMLTKLIYFVVAIIYSLCVSLYVAQRSVSFKGVIEVADGMLVYANFFPFPHHKLNSTPIESRTVYGEQDCISACTESSQCRSLNFRTIPDANGKFLCQLLDTNKFNLSEVFTTSLEFNHHSFTVSKAIY